MQVVHLSNFHPFWMAPLPPAVKRAHSSTKLYGMVPKGENLVCILQIRGLHESMQEIRGSHRPSHNGLRPFRRACLKLSSSDTPQRWKEISRHL